ncbi:hypothetical protein Ab1vBOLIVR5_gp158c [Agrobacterium phage OLIVR5]|uniref:EF-hand domain-containing protein n=1 Tax=Agrobacterium phage OLIVR5 TaxID=2723773 RepID=A0A858MSW1_9CAUD|nr:hypothetical protein KNU99_gp243 [Agrobacterium phage OLIVR5]QIW87806.1 hypothetical protein Ab1vBOLIVR5_gp158c [Agrobacterium phage OLIVR5]QIW88071.1 hypothetical protein Ab1vBOLIVR6_gp164c [Agrobacterium phage OLIVR6]
MASEREIDAIDTNHDGRISPEEFVTYQNRKWTYRRWIAFLTLFFYFFVGTVLLIKVEARDVEMYTALFVQISLFCGGIIAAYFGGSTVEELGMDRKKVFDEFIQIKELANKLKSGKDGEVG